MASKKRNDTALGPTAALTEFLATLLADQERGQFLPLSHYLRRFPRDEEAIAREFLAVRGASLSARVPPDSDPRDSSAPVASDPTERYQIVRRLGAGGMGEVLLARDRVLEREIALKIARRKPVGRDALEAALRREALTAASLSHPNIPPVHDLGVDAGGRFFYVMQPISGSSLRSVLDRRAAHSDEWSLTRLLMLFQQMCLAVDYAHARGVLHLDLKPANIMIGEFGELYLVDWGLASVTHARSRAPSHRADMAPTPGGGTPGYMSPEQASGKAPLGCASDIFSLGVILYELVTGERAFPERGATSLSARVRAARFERGDAFGLAPPELRELLERALKRDPAARPSNARDLSGAIQQFLEGAREKERRRAEAARSIDQAAEEMARRRALCVAAESLEHEIDALRPESWVPARAKAEFWRAEDRLAAGEREADIALSNATTALFNAYRQAPDDAQVVRQLAEHLWQRLLAAEDQGDRFQQQFFTRQLRDLELPEFIERLRGDGQLLIRCTPAPERATIWRLVEVERVLRPTAPRALAIERQRGDAATVAWDRIPMGSYQVRLERRGYRPLTAPIFIARGECQALDWRLRRDEEIGAAFVQVPPGAFILGGDPDTNSLPRARPVVDEFCFARFPVTMQEYLEFLREGCGRNARKVRARVPRLAQDGEPLEFFVLDGKGGVRLIRHQQSSAHRQWPVFGVSWFDARAYVGWRSRRDGRKYDLPSDVEWEKAARGTDGRIFPWGQHYDASFCKNLGSTAGKAQPEPIGRYRRDVSPYGARDVAGGVKEWCRDWYSKRQNWRLARGGGWNQSPFGSHCAYRVGVPPAQCHVSIGMRLVHRFGRR
ncbi:MAG: protein kinase domain-containing protein [Planctomycetota bacterium]